MKSSFSPTKLKGILMTMFFIVVILASAGLYFAHDYLDKLASEVIKTNPSVTSDNNDPQPDQNLINSLQGVNAKASSVYASGDYVTQIQNDINTYASKSNVSVQLVQEISPQGISDLVDSSKQNTAYIDIQISGQPSYDSLMQFIGYIEKNLPLMQIVKLDISRNNSTSVKVNSLIIEVTKK